MENSHAPFNPLGIKCPYCPMCGAEPLHAWIELTPWFCPNDDCEVFGWDPYTSASKNISEASELEVIRPEQDN